MIDLAILATYVVQMLGIIGVIVGLGLLVATGGDR